MFVVAPKAKQNENQWRQADPLTQIGRALRELGIGLRFELVLNRRF